MQWDNYLNFFMHMLNAFKAIELIELIFFQRIL